MSVTTNLSAMAREIDYLGKAIFTDVGQTLQVQIMAEFQSLVVETAQWTGTTAASWNISLGGDHSVRPQPKRSRAQALEKGHTAAVSIAMNHNANALDRLATMGLPGQKGNSYRAIMVENYSPQAEVAESGPLREVNSPAGAFDRFKERVAFQTFETIRSRTI